MSAPRNRKERRAQSKAQQQPTDINFPLAQPPRQIPTHKTLYEIASSHHPTAFPADQRPSSSSTTPSPDTTTISPPETILSTLADSLLQTLPLTALHFTLDVLVHSQYAQQIAWRTITTRALATFPALLLLVYILHPRAQYALTQAFFATVSIAAGCWLVHSSNREAYFAVMKRAPPLGTLWVWSVVEMRVGVGVACLGLVGIFFWWGEYTIF
ncbi:hypothetical protein MMC12_000927 [Toensbergia leucococca]|nr:hypothetical protein [Toensbergia leucococca]